MAHRIVHADPLGSGAKHGLKGGDVILSINGEEVIDEIDYQALIAEEKLDMLVRSEDGHERHVLIRKDAWETLGLAMEDTMICKPMLCKNNCVFCFVKQMRPGCRDTLYVKDDDWRMSLMMGNFITLTNVSDEEFDRMIRRHASPLYISVHTTDMDLRKKMLRNPSAGLLMERLQRLKDTGIRFHCQVVLCPGWNDGEQLEKTIHDLVCLSPAAQSVALVPVGLTRYRDGLDELTTYTKETALPVMEIARKWQKICMDYCGSRFVFPADEFYCITGQEIPSDEEYETYAQIENGVGMIRQLEEDLKYAHSQKHRKARKRRILLACGTSIAPTMERWMTLYCPEEVTWQVQPVKNDFFGHTVTVTGLLTGGDIAEQLKHAKADEILLADCTLRNEGDLFLDDMSIDELRQKLPAPLTVVPAQNGEALFEALLG